MLSKDATLLTIVLILTLIVSEVLPKNREINLSNIDVERTLSRLIKSGTETAVNECCLSMSRRVTVNSIDRQTAPEGCV